MKDDFNYWLQDLSCTRGMNFDNIEILIKAMWAINRETNWRIWLDKYGLAVFKNAEDLPGLAIKYIHNESEQKALEKALRYIFDNEDKR